MAKEFLKGVLMLPPLITILGNLKNAIPGTYHAFDFEKYAHRYLGEFQYRFNRRFDLPGMFKCLVAATFRSGKVPGHKLRLAEDLR